MQKVKIRLGNSTSFHGRLYSSPVSAEAKVKIENCICYVNFLLDVVRNYYLKNRFHACFKLDWVMGWQLVKQPLY